MIVTGRPSDGPKGRIGMQAKLAVVTGAGTGVGRAAALALADGGFDIVLAGRRQEPLDKVAAEVAAKGRQALAVSTDVADAASVEALFAKVREAFGRLDLLFNNAGMGAPAIPFDELSATQWQTVIGANLFGSAICAREAFRLMKAQSPRGGRIINNGSISAYAPRPNSAPYTSTKHAITGLTKSIALDGRPFDIACGQIDIGNAATELSNAIGAGILQANGTTMAEPRFDAAEVGRAVAYMAGLPLDTNVLFMTVMATKMPYVGRG
jgi:NAD(P)-dependent dehydrogenase (short-subunit alcohol dehydrogenase family)